MASQFILNSSIEASMRAERMAQWDRILDNINTQAEETSAAIGELIQVLHDLAHTVGALSGRWILRDDFSNWVCAECGHEPGPGLVESYELSLAKALTGLGNAAIQAEHETLQGVGPFVPFTTDA